MNTQTASDNSELCGSDFMHVLMSNRKSCGYRSDTFRSIGNAKILCGCRVEGMRGGKAIILFLSQASEGKLI